MAESKTGLLAAGLSSPGLTPEQLERGHTALADWHRTAGVCRLLAHADAEGFRRELLRLRARTARPFNSYTGAARNLPLCCAAAAGADDVVSPVLRKRVNTGKNADAAAQLF